MAENKLINLVRTNNNPHYRNLELPFTLKNTEIDYFHIQPDVLSLGEFDVTEGNLNLEAGEYLDLQRHFQSLDDSVQETVVLNVPVGHGKTTLCYNLIKKYYEEGYHIIVCSPFQKLVEKDHAALKEMLPKAIMFNYKELNFDTESFGGSFIQHLAEDEARIHIMTINCLLKNPGDEKFEQAFHKSRFLQKLKNSIRNKGEKVVFFFDELHESVANFKNEFIPNLTTWAGLTHKCFISSATFTSASLPVIRYISFLTLCRIKIYHTPRRKTTNQASLHLYITTEAYTSKKLYPLGKITEIIRSSSERGAKVNILCAYKIIVNALTDRNSNSPITQSVLSLHPNICTADTDNEFKPNENNIGTNFKTGVNITNSNSTLIVILPIVNKANPFGSYGIFSDGIPAIIQALARLRNGGNIHVFMYAPDTVLDLENHTQNIPVEIIQNKLSRPYKKVNESYDWMRHKYDILKSFLNHEINFLNSLVDVNEELKYHYPTFQEILIEKSQSYLLSKNEWMGKYISPYLLWAAINNQFCNASLRSITYQTKSYKTVRLTSDNMQSELLSLLSNNTMEALRNGPVRKGIDILIEVLKHSEDVANATSEGGPVQYVVNDFYLNGKGIQYTKLKADRNFINSLLRIILSIKNVNQDIDKGSYIRTNIAVASSFDTSKEVPALIGLYRRFHTLKGEFIEYVNGQLIQHKSRMLLHPDFGAEVPTGFTKKVIELIYELKERDKLLSAFTFIHNHKKALNPDEITQSMKNIIVRELEGYFLNLGNRMLYNGIKHYIVDERTDLHEVIEGINFLEE